MHDSTQLDPRGDRRLGSRSQTKRFLTNTLAFASLKALDGDSQALTTLATRNSGSWFTLANKSMPTPPAILRRIPLPGRLWMKFSCAAVEGSSRGSMILKKQERWASPTARIMLGRSPTNLWQWKNANSRCETRIPRIRGQPSQLLMIHGRNQRLPIPQRTV